jgi:hypothetical protein
LIFNKIAWLWKGGKTEDRRQKTENTPLPTLSLRERDDEAKSLRERGN